MGLFKKKVKEERAIETIDDLLLQAALNGDVMTKEIAMDIPTLAGCVELISNTIAMLPIKLYCEENGEVKEVLNDPRTRLLNEDTGDTLDAFQFKKALIVDYLLMGNGYAYINKQQGQYVSLNYVREEQVGINMRPNPIFKDYDILVFNGTYKPYDFIKILRNTKDGATGIGIIESNSKLLSVAYNSLSYENVLAKTGGNKKGFLKSTRTLTQEVIDLLKQQWNKMYSQNTENCVVLNNGLEFQESNATSTEMQMNENKIANGNEICKILNVPPSILAGDGKQSETDQEKFIKIAILPIIKALETALNRDLLQEKERSGSKSFYFAADTKELLKGDIEKRFKAYDLAIKNKILTINEIRYAEDKAPIEAFNDIVVLGLNDVLYNTVTGEVYTPNTDKTSSVTGENVVAAANILNDTI